MQKIIFVVDNALLYYRQSRENVTINSLYHQWSKYID